MGKLIIVGTPIGNPDDISVRALNYLKEAKHIVAENPDVFKTFINGLGLDKSDANIMYSKTWPEYIGEEPIVNDVLELLFNGEDVYVVCDGGMPGIADPGGLLIRECIKRNIPVVSTPGPSVIASAAVSTGCDNGFTFLGFLPKDQMIRLTSLKRFCSNPLPNLYLLINQKDYFIEAMDDLIKIWGDRNGALCYNLTTSRESIVYGKLSFLKEHWLNHFVDDNEAMLVIDSISGNMVLPPKP